jgi:hypothetical protein
MALPVTITGISTAVAPVGPFAVSITTAVDAAYITITTDNSGFIPCGTTSDFRCGQSFTIGGSNTIISSISVTLRKVAAPTDNLVLNIYAVDGSGLPIGASLATSTVISGSTLTTSYLSYNFKFLTLPTLTAATKYAFVISRSTANNSTNYYQLSTQSFINPYADGNIVREGTGTWTNSSTDCTCTINYAASLVTTYTYYFFGRDSASPQTLRAYKSTDPTVSWASVATFSLGTNSVQTLSAYQAGNVIHLLISEGNTASTLGQRYISFDAATDLFGTAEVAYTTQTATGQAAAGWGSSIVVRSTGEVVAFFNGLQTKTSGTFYARVYYSRRTAVNTWSAAVEVDAVAASDYVSPEAVLGASDAVQFIWRSLGGAVGSQRLLSSGNVLGTAANITQATTYQGVSYLNGAVTRFIVVSGGGSVAWDSGTTVTTTGVALANSLDPARPFVDGTDVIALYVKADGDLWFRKTIDHGATWQAETGAIFVGTVASAEGNLSKDATIYQRGNNVVIPYIVNDNGTLKYNEYTVRSLTTGYTLTATVGSVALAGVANKLVYARDFKVDVGAITLTGNAANLSRGYKLTAATGAIVLAGQATQLRVARQATTTTGAVTLTGNPATLTVATASRVLTATVGNIVMAGQAVNLRVARKAVASTGAVTLAGNAANLRVDHRLVAASGAVVVAGQAPTLRLAHKAVATTGVVTLAGQAPTLRLAHKAVATTGAVVLAGQPVSLRVGRGLAASSGAVVLAGNSVTLRVAHKAVVTTGVVTLTGIPVTLNQGAPGRLTALAGAIVLAGQLVGLRVARRETVAKGTIALTGQTVNLRVGRGLAATRGAIVVTGQFTTLRVARKLTVTTGVVALAGIPVTLTKKGRTLAAATGAVTVTGRDVDLRVGVTPYIPPPYVPYYPVSMASIMGVRRPAGTILKRFIVDVREPF